ncbi:MAG TPA: flagellar hook protein FlgE [Bryobacteraceae bacterium]|nr:flagellar hook protein FlgE [Bryobacteraceae bacterium]
MFNSFVSALSALKAQSAAVDTVGHNLANVSTTGYKAATVAFKDLVNESLGSGNESGLGVATPISVRNFSQGAIQSSSGGLDAAIQGNGFFVVRDNQGAKLLTRDGSFQLDRSGYITTLTGERVQQYANGVLSDILVPTGAVAAQATTRIGLAANLDNRAAVNDTFSTPIEVVDSLGVQHIVTMKYTKTAAKKWTVDALIPENAIGGSTTALKSLFGSPLPAANTIEFDDSGKLKDPAAPGTLTITAKPLTSGAKDLVMSYSLYNDKGGPNISHFAQTSAVSKTEQDGKMSSEIAAVGLADGGKVMARYGNGTMVEVASLALGLTVNPESLSGTGNNMYRASAESAQPTYATAETGGRGKVKAGALEGSTVDMAREFTNLIVFQRGYQANSRVITTSDEMSQEILNLKR